MKKENAPHIVIAGGGTGGHLFPGIAICREFQKAYPETKVLFIGTDRPFEIGLLKKAGFDHRAIPAAGLAGAGIMGKLKSLMKIPMGMISSAFILSKFKADMVIGVGGYSSGPVLLSAYFMRIPTAIHEQNTLPGLTNRFLSNFADIIFASFEESVKKLIPEKCFTTGNPVRQELIDRSEDVDSDGSGPMNILIVGGSQGAHNINIAMAEALPYIKDKDPVHVVHQTGATDEAMMRESYENNGVSGEALTFIDNMDKAYSKADLIICRAGATTMAEITALGKAALFIPYPHAADNHQVHNAKTLADTGAADMITEDMLSGKTLSEKILLYAGNRQLLKDMGKKAKTHGNPGAGQEILKRCIQLMELKKRRR